MNEDELNLLHRYLDGAITPEELESLENLLRDSAEARAALRSLATIDAKWRQLATDQAAWRQLPDHDKTTARRRFAPLWMALTVIAASLLIAALGWFRAPEERAVPIQRGIARIIRIEGEGKADQDRIVLEEAELFAGETLTMQQGLIELAFRETGVHVVATAPLKLLLDSDQRVLLHEGQIKLVVPPQGVGFVVDTAQRKFTDLGTSFVVTASAKGSEVLVLDGQIAIGGRAGESEELMHEGEFAKFDRDGKLKKRSPSRLSLALPELSLPVAKPGAGSLPGVILGYARPNTKPRPSAKPKPKPRPSGKPRLSADVIGPELSPLIRSGFQDRACLKTLKQSKPISFRGVAGAYREFPDRAGLTPYSREDGWMAWHHGQAAPPQPGRYRFWGYADNHLLVAIDGKPVFEGSRRDSALKNLGVSRTDNPSLPCLIATAGFACGPWVELNGDPVQLDILFGEIGGNLTSGLLLVEREGAVYEETFWGQPKWPLFLTETPEEAEIAEFERLVRHLEPKMMGSFSIAQDAIWEASGSENRP